MASLPRSFSYQSVLSLSHHSITAADPINEYSSTRSLMSLSHFLLNDLYSMLMRTSHLDILQHT